MRPGFSINRGALELLSARYDVARLKRAIDLAEAALNAGRNPDPARIERTLERELNDEAWVKGRCATLSAETEELLRLAEALKPFQREPTNQFDALAIRIHDEAGHVLGWVPREKNEVLARLMDAGKLLFGRLEAKSWVGGWLKLEIRVFLREF